MVHTPQSTPQADRMVTRSIRRQTPNSPTPQVYPLPDSSPEKTPNNSNGNNDLPAHYQLLPTVPSPFAGTLEASLDALLAFRLRFPATAPLMDALLRPPDTSTNFPLLCQNVLAAVPVAAGRALLEEVLFLATRTLLPEQVAQNRALMGRMYAEKRGLATRVTLRYDMLREWKTKGGTAGAYAVMESVPPPPPPRQLMMAMGKRGMARRAPPPSSATHYARPALMLNMLPILIAAPPEGWGPRRSTDMMRHHVTELDSWLLLADEAVAGWTTTRVLLGVGSVLLMWQWLRGNTEVLEEMEVRGWEGLEGRAEECGWVREGRRERDRAERGNRERERERS